jgi:hypothetical protein
MSLPYSAVPPLDPNLYTAQVRVLSGPVRTGTVTYDTGFSNSTSPPGVLEFSRWIYVGTTGNLSYTKWDGTVELLPNLAAGIWHPIYAVNVTTTNTTIAANMLRWGS